MNEKARTIADTAPAPAGRFTLLEPLRQRTYRTIWIASLFSNFGQLIQGVGAAWLMTRLSSSPQMVALVQTSLMLPLMLVALPAGAVADMRDHIGRPLCAARAPDPGRAHPHTCRGACGRIRVGADTADR